MLAEVAGYVYAHPGPGWGDGNGPWNGGAGWWLIFPTLFWLLVLSSFGYLIYRRSPTRSARSAAERILAERFARGEISEEELKQRRAVLRR
ncbi:SHOCT domain-containing protein [Micromonospora sp. NPDC093277]|uniref:SHOCT domain-containing protein n=1 Tax=Micromonospora sp. NPDC093277 TaxID=3364291 RepID=UPI0038158E15